MSADKISDWKSLNLSEHGRRDIFKEINLNQLLLLVVFIML